MNSIEFFLNSQQHKVSISGNYFYPLVSFVIFIVNIHKFDEKVLHNVLINYYVLKELICQVQENRSKT